MADEPADQMRVLVKADAFLLIVIDGIDLVRSPGKAVAGNIIAIETSNLLWRIAKEILELIVRFYAQDGADIAKTGLLLLNDRWQIALCQRTFAVIENVGDGYEKSD